MQQGSVLTIVFAIISFVLSWLLVRNTPLFHKELYGLIVVTVVCLVAVLMIRITTRAWLLFVLAYGALLLNAAYLYWRTGHHFKLTMAALVVVFVGFVHAILQIGCDEEAPTLQPEVYDADEVKSEKAERKIPAKKSKAKKRNK